ncbi:hypothetical protein ACFQL0_14430 [Haloplanus litoreus]|uniref:hypothetical protein n=1 Tax=Haloplanus litoreus TaxID=767515 RepID=UPI0036245ECE
MEYESDTQELWVNRLGSAAIIVISLFLAYFVQILVGILGVVGWALFAAPIVPLLGIGLNWRGATREGAIAAVVASSSSIWDSPSAVRSTASRSRMGSSLGRSHSSSRRSCSSP